MSASLRPVPVTDARRIGRRVECLAEVDSTNDAVLAAAARGEPEGLCVVADVQRRGRGRLGRAWHSPPGGLWCSVLLRPTLPLEDRPFLTVLGALGCCRAIEAVSALRPRIRWPNDVLVDGRKVAGVLVELRDGPGGAVAALGVGCNVAAVPGDLPADVAAATTCLDAEAGAPIDRRALLEALCLALDDRYDALGRGARDALDAEWRDRSAVLGARVRVSDAATTCEGRVTAIGATAGVTLALPDGATRRFRSEHITRLELL